MRIRKRRATASLRSMALVSLAAFVAPFVAPPVTQAQSTGLIPVVQALSTRQKVVLLAGAAALYWLYRHHQNARAEGPNGRYYRSRNGRIYYRDPRTHQAIWVTPPPVSQPIAVPADEYQRVTGQVPPTDTNAAGNSPVLTAPPGPPGPPSR
jgi:hypothetical protein